MPPSMSEILDENHGFEPYFPEQRIPPSESLIDEVEAEIGTALPKDYRSFLLRYGGTAAAVAKDCTPEVWVAERQGLYTADYVLGFFHGQPVAHLERFDLRRAYREMRPEIGDPWLPIMIGEGDNVFCLKLLGAQIGSIWAWLKEPVDINTPWDEIREVRKLYWVAADVCSFVCSFRAPDTQ